MKQNLILIAAVSIALPLISVRWLVEVCVEYIADRRLAIAYTSFFYVVVYLLPVMTMLVAYGRIVVTLWRRRPIGDSPQTTRDSHRRLKVPPHIIAARSKRRRDCPCRYPEFF